MIVSGMTRLNTTEYKFILIVVFLNFNLLLMLSIYNSSIRFRIWTSKGKKKLNEFLADMGLPLLQCNQTFQSMDMDIRREVCGWIEVSSMRLLEFNFAQ